MRIGLGIGLPNGGYYGAEPLTIVSPSVAVVPTTETDVMPLVASQSATWVISGGADESLFEIGPGNVLSFLVAEEDEGTYSVDLTATAVVSGAFSTITVTVTVEDPPSNALYLGSKPLSLLNQYLTLGV